MAQTRKKRKRKHRGTPAGTIERASSDRERRQGSRPLTKDQKREESRRRRAERFDRPPSWKSATQRAGIAAVMFAVLVVIVFDEKIKNAVLLAAFMLLVYIPFGYFFDSVVYRRRQRSKEKQGAR
jgi:Flp pilus assembly protein TadB